MDTRSPSHPRVLVAYATAAGSTTGVAERIAQVLGDAGATVTCRPVGPDLEPTGFDAVVVGSAVHNMAWLPPALDFLRRVPAGRPLWCFSVGGVNPKQGLTRKMAELEARRIAEQFPRGTSPREHRIFGGIIDMRGTPMWGKAFYRLTGGRPGDHRDWPVIEAWGSQIAGALMSTAAAVRESAAMSAVGERQVAAARETSAAAAPDASGARRALGVACGLMSATAVAGVVGLVGDGIDLGPTITARLPFHSQVLGGVALAGIVAVPMGAAAVAGWRRSARTGDFAVLAGTALGGWIVGQVAIIRTFSWMQPVCFAYGVAVAGAGHALRRRPAPHGTG